MWMTGKILRYKLCIKRNVFRSSFIVNKQWYRLSRKMPKMALTGNFPANKHMILKASLFVQYFDKIFLALLKKHRTRHLRLVLCELCYFSLKTSMEKSTVPNPSYEFDVGGILVRAQPKFWTIVWRNSKAVIAYKMITRKNWTTATRMQCRRQKAVCSSNTGSYSVYIVR